MKKFITLFLASCLVLTVSSSLFACNEGHEHKFKEEWAYNQTHHWHECEHENCLEFSGKVEHDWDDGVITSQPNAESDGVKTYTCLACGATTTDKLEYEGATESEWNFSLSEQKFDNVTMSYTLDPGDNSEENHVIKVADGLVYRQAINIVNGVNVGGFSTCFSGDEAIIQRRAFLQLFIDYLAERENFVYDSQIKMYVREGKVTSTVYPDPENPQHKIVEEAENLKVSFDANGNLVKFIFDITESIYEGNQFIDAMSGNISLTCSNYGTTVITDSEKQAND